MSDADLIARLRSFERAFPRFEDTYRRLVEEGQRPTTLFIGCSDSRLVPHQLTGTGPGDLFLVRNVGNIVPPWDVTGEGHGSAAAIEFAVLALGVRNIVVCGHSECGGMRALYEPPPEEARHLSRWLVHAHPAKLPEAATPEVLRRVEQRNVVLQLEHLMTYPMVRRGVEGGTLSLHGWHFLLGDGRVLVLDIARGTFEPVERSLERLAADAAEPDPAAPR